MSTCGNTNACMWYIVVVVIPKTIAEPKTTTTNGAYMHTFVASTCMHVVYDIGPRFKWWFCIYLPYIQNTSTLICGIRLPYDMTLFIGISHYFESILQ